MNGPVAVVLRYMVVGKALGIPVISSQSFVDPVYSGEEFHKWIRSLMSPSLFLYLGLDGESDWTWCFLSPRRVRLSLNPSRQALVC